MVGKRLVNTGGAGGAAAFDALANFETVTYTGNGGTQKITGYIRKGAAFDGSSSYISLPSSSPFDDSDTIKSISAWVKPNTSTSLVNIYSFSSTSSSKYYFTFNWDNNNSRIQVRAQSGATTSRMNAETTITPTTDWVHVVAQLGASSIEVWVNGVQKTLTFSNTGTATNTSWISYPNYGTAEGRIGLYRITSPLYSDGIIDQVRFFNTALDSSKINTLSNETYTSSTKSTTDIFGDGSGIALYELDEDANDTDGADGKFNNAAIFNSTNGRINTNLVPTYNSFTASLWLYIPTGQGFVRILNSLPTGLPNPMVHVHYGSPLSDDLTVQIYDGVANVNVTKNNIPTDTWFHLAFSYTSGGSLKGYYNGVEFDSNSIATLAFTNTSPFYIGYDLRNNTYGFNGRADQVRMYSAELTSQQISDLASETNIPTNNLLLHYKLDGNANDETGNYNGTAQNITYTGYNGTSTNVNFLGMAFQPDLVWIKQRDESLNHVLFDSVRGAGNRILTNLTIAEDTGDGYGVVNSFDSNGFTVDIQTQTSSNNVNKSGGSYVAWCWKAGGAAGTYNIDGTGHATLGAAGLSITGNGGNSPTFTGCSINTASGFGIYEIDPNHTASNHRTDFTHGLNSTPELIITKIGDLTSNWHTFTNIIDGSTDRGKLNTTAEFVDDTLNGVSIATSTEIRIEEAFTSSSNSFLFYVFHSIDGYQKVGSYNGGASGNAITGLGFEPRFLMIKRTNSTGGWIIFDSVRDTTDPRTEFLGAHQDLAESTIGGGVDFDSDGFTLQSTNSTINTSGGIYIYLAIV